MRIAIIFALVACGNVTSKPDAAGSGDARNIDASHGDGASGDGTQQVLDCQHYCQATMAACSANFIQYAQMTDCMAACPAFAPGALGDASGNTLGCRLTHAGLAAQDPATHCVHAGPSGGGACGTACEGFCTIDRAVCTGANVVYQDATQCATACAGFSPQPPYTSNVTSGNSLSCRIYHAVAAASVPTIHCQHTAINSATCQ